MRGASWTHCRSTFFGPQGDYREGAEDVVSTYEHDAKPFEPGGDSQSLRG